MTPKGRMPPVELPGDQLIQTFIESAIKFRGRIGLLDQSEMGKQRTGVTRDHTQLWLAIHPALTPDQAGLSLYQCWRMTVGRTLLLLPGEPPISEGVPGEQHRYRNSRSRTSHHRRWRAENSSQVEP